MDAESLRRRWRSLAALGSLVALVGCVHGPELRAGDRAPDFELPGTDGRVHRLADHRGREVVVLAWFPKAFTGG